MPKTKPTITNPLDEQIGFRLRLAQLAVFSDIIDALKPYDLRPVDFSVLLLLDAHPGLRQHVIGDQLKMARPNVAGLVDGLVKRELIDRVVDATDRRAHQLSLTDKGAALLVEAKRAQELHRARLMQALAGVDIAQLMNGLERLAKLGG